MKPLLHAAAIALLLGTSACVPIADGSENHPVRLDSTYFTSTNSTPPMDTRRVIDRQKCTEPLKDSGANLKCE